VKQGFVSLQGLCDGTVSMRTFFEALKLTEFEIWAHGLKENNVEYFD
jgi:hypothetical protein